MATYREVIYDIYQSLKQSYDDSELTLSHIRYWVGIAGSRLKMQHIEKRDSGAFLNIYPSVEIEQDSTTGYKYIELPAGIIDFDKDGGVKYISYSYRVDDCTPPFTSVQFSRTTPSASRRLYFTDEEKPCPSNPYYYRSGDNLYLLGLECVNPRYLEIGLYLTIGTMQCDLDADFPLPTELLPVLQKYVLDLGRWVLTIPENYINDGTGMLGGASEMPKSKLVSVNRDLIGQQEQQQK